MWKAIRRGRRGWLGLLTLIPILFVALSAREAQRVEVSHPVVYLPGLSPAFAGLKIALLTDIHRGPFMSATRVRRLVDLTNAQHPDIIALTGDYVHRSKEYIPSVWAELGRLTAPLGVYAVLGNHDYWESGELSFVSMTNAGITNLTNRHVVIERGGQKLYLAGLDDPWAGKPDLPRALQGVAPHETAVVLCHNPDYIEQVADPRAKLWLSGHTHGGQICLIPNRPILHPSKCGLRYIAGLAICAEMQIYVSRGLGTVSPPLRWNCPAELPIIELQPALHE